ncbi:MAG: hypothetical protein HZB16_08445 [Armatimonadetes bacterium]|nr:hypothetical protein [Armatimonadota bacterium]
MSRSGAGSLAAMAAGSGQRVMLRGPAVTDYLVGSLLFCARHPDDLAELAPRALGWYRHLCAHDIRLPLGVVLDLGYMLLSGDDFRFRDYFADRRLSRAEQVLREQYEQRVLLRRLQESAFARLSSLLRGQREQDEALALVLEILLRPIAARLSQRYEFDLGAVGDLDVQPRRLADRLALFESTVERPGVVLGQVEEVVRAAGLLDLDQRLADEDFYEIEHIRVFPRASLREVARGIKRAERVLGSLPRIDARGLRERALARTNLSSVGTYPVGGIAEISTRGPIENLVPSELLYLERGRELDLFSLRYAENELLRWLRDGAVLHLMRRTMVFYLDESDALLGPVTVGDAERGLRGVKLLRCVLGLVLSLVSDLVRVFAHDDVRFELRLVQPEGAAAALGAERREVAEVLRLLLADREAAGMATVTVDQGSLADLIAARRADTSRAVTIVGLAPREQLVGLDGLRLNHGQRLVMQPIRVGNEPATDGAIDFTLDPIASLRAARARLLGRMFA